MSYRQIRFSEEQLRAGLDSRLNWTSPGEYLAELRLEPAHLQEQFGIQFQPSFDQLDHLNVARVELPSKRQVTFIRHCGSPRAGTLVSADVKDIASSTDLVDEVLTALGMDPSHVTWRAPRLLAWPMAGSAGLPHER